MASSTHAMSHADAAWLHMDRPTNPMVINALMWFSEPLERDALIAVVEERLIPRFPRFSQVVREGIRGPHWEDDPHFDIRNHVHRIALPAPGGRAELQELAGDLATGGIDRDLPLWSLHLIEGYGEGSAMHVRMHHCIADGIALARVMMSLTDDDAGFATVAEENGHGPLGMVTGAVALGASAVKAGASLVLKPDRVLGLVEQGAADAGTVAKLLFARNDPHGALKGELGVRQRVAWSPSMQLDRIRRVAKDHDATINDVVVAAVAGGLRRYLESQGAAVHDVHALVPFNLRSLDGPLPRDLGNRFGLVTLRLPVAEPDPVARVAAVKAEMRAIKASHEPEISYGLLDVVGRGPAALEAKVVDFMTGHGSLVLTNVPGPRRVVHLAGTPIQGVLVWAPTSGSLGMSVSVFSYRGKVTVGFLADAALVEEPEVLVAGFTRELRELS